MRVDDLTRVEADAKAALGPDAIARAEPKRLILMCSECAGAPMVDVRLGRQTDGTEQRVRSGETSTAQLEALCRARDPDCRLERSDVGAAVGWLTSYKVGTSAANTLMLLSGGDLLTVRVVAADSGSARGALDRLKAGVVPAIVGR